MGTISCLVWALCHQCLGITQPTALAFSAGYCWVLLFVLLLFSLSFLTFFESLLQRISKAPSNLRLASGLAALILFFNNMPSLSEGFFWYSSAMTYMLPLAATFGLFSLLFLLSASQAPKPIILIAALLLIAIAIGGN